MAYRLTGRYEEAIAALQESPHPQPQSSACPPLTWLSCYSELGREEEARAEVAEVLRLSPNFSLEGVRQMIPFKDPAVLERYACRPAQGGAQINEE